MPDDDVTPMHRYVPAVKTQSSPSSATQLSPAVIKSKLTHSNVIPLTNDNVVDILCPFPYPYHSAAAVVVVKAIIIIHNLYTHYECM